MNRSSVWKYINDNIILKLKNLDNDKIQKMKIKPNSLSLSHINSRSLNKNFEDLNILLNY